VKKRRKSGSHIARQGFQNEKDMIEIFNQWRTDPDGQRLLEIMGYDVPTLVAVKAGKFPRSRSKPDIQVEVEGPTGTDFHRVSCKRVEKTANYNHLGRKSISKYQDQWGFSDSVKSSLQVFTGEYTPTPEWVEVGTEQRDLRRLYLTEMKAGVREGIVDFFNLNASSVVKDIFLGTDTNEMPDWMLFTYIDDAAVSYHLHPIEEVVEFYTGEGSAHITSRGNLVVGRLRLQRKGGKGNPFDMQFKFRPRQFLENQNEF
jgi:hypothetical protein